MILKDIIYIGVIETLQNIIDKLTIRSGAFGLFICKLKSHRLFQEIKKTVDTADTKQSSGASVNY